MRRGRPALRRRWIEERGDTDELPYLTSEYGRERLTDPDLDRFRFRHIRNPPPRIVQLGHVLPRFGAAGDRTPEMEYIAIRENMRRQEFFGTGLMGGRL